MPIDYFSFIFLFIFVYSEIKKNPIRHIDTISVIIDIVGEIFMSRQIIATIAFNKHPINAIKAAVLKFVIFFF